MKRESRLAIGELLGSSDGTQFEARDFVIELLVSEPYFIAPGQMPYPAVPPFRPRRGRTNPLPQSTADSLAGVETKGEVRLLFTIC
jgi:hypothetical protein